MQRQCISVTVAAILLGGLGCGKGKTAGTVPTGGDTSPPAECGNGARVGGEQCDGVDLAGQTCVSLGYDGGTLGCASTCTFDYAACTGTPPACGDNLAEGLEACDGTDLRDETCTLLGYDGGALACVNCAFDTSACTGMPPVCGDNNAEGLEECDGIDLRQLDCADLGFAGGTLACDSTCRLVTGACIGTAGFCGDGTAQGLEECDGQDLNGLQCTDLGYTGGTLTCDASCRFETTACIGTPAVCGDDVQNGLEECDGTDLAGQDCVDLDFTGGTLACDSSCTFDATACTQPVCGNNTLEPGEACDGTDLDGQDCTDLGLGSGAVTCNTDCTFNTSACALPTCGDGAINQTSEECDGADLDGQDCADLTFLSGRLLCNDDCTFNTLLCFGTTAVCDDGTRDLSEECEGTDLGEASCVSLGWDGGTLACTAQCTYDTTACTGTAPTCLDGVAEGDEQCDGTDLRDLDCTDFWFTGGTLACSPQCNFSFVACTNNPICGNDNADRGEVCDGTDLRSATCASLDAGTGTLACLSDCSAFDFSGCTAPPTCGNDIREGLEVCDGTDVGTLATCNLLGYTGTEAVGCLPTCAALDLSACTGETGQCGNDHRQWYEQCDGIDLDNASCTELGYDSGDLDCNDNCSFDVTACTL
jgi:hypothetical protein